MARTPEQRRAAALKGARTALVKKGSRVERWSVEQFLERVRLRESAEYERRQSHRSRLTRPVPTTPVKRIDLAPLCCATAFGDLPVPVPEVIVDRPALTQQDAAAPSVVLAAIALLRGSPIVPRPIKHTRSSRRSRVRARPAAVTGRSRRVACVTSAASPAAGRSRP